MTKSTSTWRDARIDWLMDEVREQVTVQDLAGRNVFHYSIPVVSETGDGQVEEGGAIESAKLLLRGGELLVSRLNPRKSHVLIAKAPMDPTVCSGEFVVLRPRRCDSRYLYYLFSSEDVRQALDARARSVTKSHQRVPPEAITKLWVTVPPLPVQKAIADFLDRETARIDGLIAKKHALARSLIERFQVTLAHAFLSVRASLAAEERPLRWVAEVLLGRQRAPEHDQGPHMVRYLRAANVKDGELDLSDVKEMNFTPAEQRIFALARGDVLVSEGAGSLAAVGATAVWNAELAGTICFQNTLLRIRPRGDVDARFLGWWSRHAFSSGLFAAVAGGANIYHLGAQRVRGLPIAVPPIDTQRATVDRLDREEAQAHRAIQSLEAQLALLAERRQALITSAVSGLVELDALREVDRRLG